MSAFHFIKGPYLLLLAAAIVLRILLGVFAPDANGYVWDFYSDAIILTYEHGKIPEPDACWVCYHPPLLPVLGTAIFHLLDLFDKSLNVKLYAVAWFLNGLSIMFAVYSFAIYLKFRKYPQLDLVLWGLLLFLPVSFISSFSIESDMLVSTLVVISLYYFVSFLQRSQSNHLYVSAIFVALAALTKYSGLTIAIFYGVILLFRFIKHRDPSRFKQGLKYAGIVILVGGFPYINNMVESGSLIVGNKAWNNNHGYYTYNFKDFSIPRIMQVFEDKRPLKLKKYYQYNSEVLNSLYGQLWTDFSFYTIPYRHGQHEYKNIYPGKTMPEALLWAILASGLAPVISGALGFTVLCLQKDKFLLVALLLISTGLYIHWFMGHNYWMLKTKYLLFLLPVWLISINHAGRLINPVILQKLLIPCVFFSLLYCFLFAIF